MKFQEQTDLLQQKGLYRSLKSVGYIDRQYIEVEDKGCTNYASDDYLGLGQIAFDEDDFERFMRKYSYHLSSSRLIGGSSTAYEEIEAVSAGWLEYSAYTILNNGYDTSSVLFNIFKNTNCVMFSGQENRTSIIDGIRLSSLEEMIYKHLDIADLEERLEEYPNQDIPKIVISDSVFSTSGDVVDIGQLVSLEHRCNATLILDVSYSFGIENYSNYRGVDILTSSLSKAYGIYGGVILGSNDMKDMLINHGRPLIHSSSLPIYNLYFTERNIEKLINADDRRTKLNSSSRYFNRKLKTLNVDYNSSDSPIKFIEFDDIEAAENIHQALLKRYVLTSYLEYPTVAKPMLGISLPYFHAEQDMDRLFEILHQED